MRHTHPTITAPHLRRTLAQLLYRLFVVYKHSGYRLIYAEATTRAIEAVQLAAPDAGREP